MIIDFEKIEPNVIKNFKGGDKEANLKTFSDSKNKIIYGILEKDASIGYHKHETNSEIIYIINGKAKVIYDDTEELLTTGMCHYCKKNHSHSLINNGTEALIFFAVVPEQ